MRTSRLTVAALTAVATGFALSASTGADGFVVYEVTVTNVTKGQIISPPVVASHRAAFSLFATGQPASPQLAALAEDAIVGPLVAALEANPAVFHVAVGDGPIPPGQSLTVPLRVRPPFDRVTAAGMLVTTNDTFFAVRGAPAPRVGGALFRSPGYDAGSEENNELCAFIPGPPCGNAEVRTGSSEGFVYVGNGVRGVGDLSAAALDWRNPVADVSVRRAR